ncbi:glycosyltransferase family 2 protein [Telluribacter humicola]|uniref:glycosyltransferase family 2 protein n=1 Tax=Telluribacter humicola TaxID=1720261 RepID=UPI001A979A45|nr:glycosyltransferase family 2 protein [Telluribacter humicola]
MEPLVSVILPVYNQERYIAETIESVLAQTYQNFELLILDDGSTDKSAQVIREYAQTNDRITAYYEDNSGRCTATNKLVDRAKGEWCALLDADDVMLPNRLEQQVNFHLENKDIDASSCHCYYINKDGKILGVQRHPFLKNKEECESTYKSNKLIQCAMTGLFISRKAYTGAGGLKKEFWPCDDFEFFNRLIEKKYNLVIKQDILMKYRIHSSSITAKQPLHTFDVIGYVIECINLRRNNKPVISYEEFKAKRDQEPFWIKLNRRRYNYAQIYFRNAGVSLMSKEYIPFSIQILLSLVLSPAHAFTKLVNLTGK